MVQNTAKHRTKLCVQLLLCIKNNNTLKHGNEEIYSVWQIANLPARSGCLAVSLPESGRLQEGWPGELLAGCCNRFWLSMYN